MMVNHWFQAATGVEVGADLTFSDWVQIGVAGATLVLALVTFFMMTATRKLASRTDEMVKATRDMASATQEMVVHAEAEVAAGRQQVEAAYRQSQLSADALRASIVPWLTTVEGNVVTIRETRTGIVVDVMLRNAGAGLALIQPDTCWVWPNPDYESDWQQWRRKGRARASVLGVGEQTRIRFEVAGDASFSLGQFSGRAQRGIFGDFRSGVSYTDARGEQRTYANLCIADVTGDGAWRVIRITYRWEDDSEPFADVEFG